jgi:MFS family permease
VTALAALRAIFASPALRRLQVAWLGSIAGEFSYSVALSVYAYRQGGAGAVGLVWLLRTIPAAAGAPFAALLGDRYRRELVMLAANVVRAAATGGTALAILADAPAALPYALGVLVALLSTIFWPAQAALLPSLARTPAELTAANTASTTLEAVGGSLGSALCGFLLAATSIELAFAATAAVFAASALTLTGVRAPAPTAASSTAAAVLSELFGGFRTVAAEPQVRLLVGVYGAWAFVTGALNVLVVVSAIELLDLGEGGVGLLNAAISVGGLVGAIAALALVARQLLARLLVLGTVVWSLPIALLGVWPEAAAAVVLLAVLGVGYVLIDVAALTLLQRTVRDEVRSRVLGIIEGLWVGTIGIGAAVTPVLIDLVGVRVALAIWGAVLPVATLAAWRALHALDAFAPPTRELGVLHGVPFLRTLPGPTLEALAAQADWVRVPSGETIVRAGEHGDRFYVVADGDVEVSMDGKRIAELGAGDFFGEIALLRDVPRTATVTAVRDTALLALERADFLAAVTGYAESAAAADAVVRTRLRGAVAVRRRV